MKCLCLSTTGIFKIDETYINGSELTAENFVISVTTFIFDSFLEFISIVK